MELKTLEQIIKETNVCKGALKVIPLAEKLKTFLESVKLPSLLEDPAQKYGPLNLEKSSPEAKLRLQDLKYFLAQPDVKGKPENDIYKKYQAFLEERKLVTDKVLEDAYGLLDSENSEDVFVHKAGFEGVILRTSPSFVSVITLDGSEEVLLRVDRKFVGLGIQVKTGDIISAANPKSTRNLDPELKCCYQINTDEVNNFLDMLKAQDDACLLLEYFSRSSAVWKYVLNVSVKNEQQPQLLGEMCKSILEVCQKVRDISTNSAMAGTIRNFWTSFVGSKFFNEVLQAQVQDKAWQDENVNLVKTFLENLLKYCPECGVRAIEIVNKLNIDNPMEFMTKLLSILALNVTGVKDNPKHLKWNQQPIIPVSHELHTTATQLKESDLPCVKVAGIEKKKSSKDCRYKSEEEYIKTYYTLLREECFHKLKKGINNFLLTGEFDPKDIMMYRVRLVKAVPNINKSVQEGLDLLFEFKTRKNEESDDPDNSNWLMFGNLLCLSFDGTFKCPVWGIISGDPENKAKDGMTQIQVSLCSERNKLSEAEVITKLQQLEDQGFPAYMVESNTFYRAYGPPLEVLQQKESVPFKEQLVDIQKCTNQPPEYLKNLKKRPDWSIIFNCPSCVTLHENDDDYSYDLLIKEFEELRQNQESEPRLDEKQLDAVEQALRNKVTLIQGPPGTGKSYVGEALLQLLLSMEVPDHNGPILVVTYKNHALDNFLQTSAEKIPGFLDKLVRVGRGSDDASEDLKKRRITELLKNSTDDDRETSCNYYQTSRRLKLQLEAMKPEIDKCVKGIRSSNKFTVSVFIEEADDKHILHLSGEHKYTSRIKEIMKDKNFRVKHFKELSKMIEEPLKAWLPKKEKFEEFAGKVTVEGLQSCLNEDYEMIKQKRSKNQEVKMDDQALNSRQSEMPSEEREERKADFNVQEDENESVDNETLSLEEGTLMNLPEIPDEKLGPNVKAILNAGNIKQLKDPERIQMVYALQRKRYKAVSDQFVQLTQDFTQKQQRRKEVYDQRQIRILQQHKVIGMTVSGAAIRASWLESINPSVMIVEEAAEILESQLVAVIPSSVQHLIMIGDHQQLRPQVHYEKLCRKCSFHISMFERLIRGGLDYAQLNQQGRMSDDLAELVRKLGIYKEYKTRDSVEAVQNSRALECLSVPMYFYDHTREEKTQKGSHSMYNEHEAEMIVQVAKYLVCDNDVATTRITILCSYRGQVSHLQHKLKNQDAYKLSDITVTTIDSFQGKENDIILLSLVRSKRGKDAKIGYLRSINRICVAVSRARIGLYLFGNTFLLRKNSIRGWQKIIDHMLDKRLVGKNIQILMGGAVVADGASPGSAGRQERNQPLQSPEQIHINIQKADVVNIGDHTQITYNDGNHQINERPQQQSTPLRPPKEDQLSQSVEETSKHNTSSPTAQGCDDQHSQERQPVEETSKDNLSSAIASSPSAEEHVGQEVENPQPSATGVEDSLNLPSGGDSEAQEMSWVGNPHPAATGESDAQEMSWVGNSPPSVAEESDAQEMSWVGNPRPSAAGDSDAQEMSWVGNPQPSVAEADGSLNLPSAEEAQELSSPVDPQAPAGDNADESPLQETGDVEKGRPVQDTCLPKRQEQGQREENEKVQAVEETRNNKEEGQLVVGTQSDQPLLLGDAKASGEDEQSPKHDSNVPVHGASPQDEKKGITIFDDEEACILYKRLLEAPGSADLISKLQDLQVNNPEFLGDIDLDNQELTIGEIGEKGMSDVQKLLNQYLEEQGCNCDGCGSLR